MKKAELLISKIFPFTLTLFALRMAKTQWSFGHSECNRVKGIVCQQLWNYFPTIVILL